MPAFDYNICRGTEFMTEHQWTIEAYEQWLLSQKNDAWVIHEETIAEHINIFFDAGDHIAQVVFHNENIIELMILNKSTESNEFYLHFQLNSEEHARDLSQQMLATLIKVKNRHAVNVLLTCTSALTTSFLAERLNAASELMHADMHFNAVPFPNVYEEGIKYDVILLAPQISFEAKKVADTMPRQIVLSIPAGYFASYDTGAILNMTAEAIKKHNEENAPEEEIPQIREIYHNNYRILSICLINHDDGNRFAYRIYDHGSKTLNKEVIKQNLVPEDIDDLLDYIMVRHHNIDLIGISLPGVTYRGEVYVPAHRFYHTQLAKHVQEKYGLPCVVINDANAMALGYYAMHDNCDNMCFYFQPRGMATPGVGTMIDGRLHLGYKHNSGEVRRITYLMMPDADAKTSSPEGMMEIVSNNIIALMGTIAPDKIVIYSEMTPDMEALRELIAKREDPVYIPELVHVTHLKRYMMPGTMIRCLELIKQGRVTPGKIIKDLT